MSTSIFARGLQGEGIHVNPLHVFDELSWKDAHHKVEEDLPYTIGQLLFHMNYWQQYILELINNNSPESPKQSIEEWGSNQFPESEKEWEDKLLQFKEGLHKAEEIAKQDLEGKSELLMELIMHNSYHAGQVVVVRRLIKEWHTK